MEDEPIGVQIGIVPDTLPHATFQIFRQPDRQVLALSPFRLGEQPNIRVGVAMITSAPEALALHEKMAKELLAARAQGRGGGQVDAGPDRATIMVILYGVFSPAVQNLEKILILVQSAG